MSFSFVDADEEDEALTPVVAACSVLALFFAGLLPWSDRASTMAVMPSSQALMACSSAARARSLGSGSASLGGGLGDRRLSSSTGGAGAAAALTSGEGGEGSTELETLFALGDRMGADVLGCDLNLCASARSKPRTSSSSKPSSP